MVTIITVVMGFLSAIGLGVASVGGEAALEKDVIKTAKGDIEITFVGHGSLMIRFDKKVIHVDPFGELADYSVFPKADLVLLTHDHFDHLDSAALKKVRSEGTAIILTEKCAKQVTGGIIMRNGDTRQAVGITIEAVPAYNLVHKRPDGQPFHPKGEGNGYLLTLGDKVLYLAGDTENIPEMKSLKAVDIAFLPANLPYTMTPEMVADAVWTFRPKVLYPYHFGETDTNAIKRLLSDVPDLEVRIRRME